MILLISIYTHHILQFIYLLLFTTSDIIICYTFYLFIRNWFSTQPNGMGSVIVAT